MNLKSRFSKIVEIIPIVLISLCISFLFFGKNLHAKMGIIDDHELLVSGVLSDSSAVWNNFKNSSEIKSFGKIQRFRVIYGLINNTETLLFRTNASYWYLTNIFVFAFFIFTIFYLIYKNTNIKWAIPFTLYVISSSYFALIFTRLGTAEVWTILGCSIYALGFNSIYHKSKLLKPYSGWKEWLAMILGGIITIGSKENFAIMGVLFITLFIILKLRHKVTLSSLFSTIFLLFINGYQILDIQLTQKNKGVDFYQNNSETIYRIKQVILGLFSESSRLFTILSIIFIILISIIYYLNKKVQIKKYKQNISKLFFTPLISTLILILFFTFNLYIYNGIFYISHRYSFPSVLVTQIQFLIVVKWLYDIKNILLKNKYDKILTIICIVFTIILIKKDYKNYIYCNQISDQNVQATNLFQNKLNEIIIKIKECPDCPVILSSYLPFDYEPLILSVPRYLKYNNISNKIMVKTDYNSVSTENNPLAEWVISENIKHEMNGGDGFTPNNLSKDEKCLLIDFSGTTTNTQCKNLGKIWQLGNYQY